MRPARYRYSIGTASAHARALLAIATAACLWGTSYVATKTILVSVPPLTLAALRFAVALAVLFPLVRRAGAHLARGWVPALMGLTGVFLFFVLQDIGLRFASAATASLIDGGTPVLTALLAAAILGDRLCRRQTVGILAAALGVASIVLVQDNHSIAFSWRGDGLLILAAACFAAYTILGRHLFQATKNVLPVVAGSVTYGLVGLIPAAGGELAVEGISHPTVRALGLLLYLGAGCSAIAYALMGYALRHLAVAEVAVFDNLIPLVGLFAAALVLREPLRPIQLGGGVFILGGVWLTTRVPSTAVSRAQGE